MTEGKGSWRPTATRAMLGQRAALLARTRAFFAARKVLEVDTPIVVNAPVTDVHIHSAKVLLSDAPRPYFLHTSPEYAMKRLLAAGSGDIYQICHVVRGFERGRLHNAEFTLIEWYRLGFSLAQLMDEVEELVRELLGEKAARLRSERVTYRDAVYRALQIDPLAAATEDLIKAAAQHGFTADNRDAALDFLMGTVVGPQLGKNALTFVHGYPASQAALARLDPQDLRTALRFELYGEGIELANGFQELASVEEQRTRFQQDNEERRRRGLPVFEMDERLLAALEEGLPECAGVAIGFDRVVMVASGARGIEEVVAFTIERA